MYQALQTVSDLTPDLTALTVRDILAGQDMRTTLERAQKLKHCPDLRNLLLTADQPDRYDATKGDSVAGGGNDESSSDDGSSEDTDVLRPLACALLNAISTDRKLLIDNIAAAATLVEILEEDCDLGKKIKELPNEDRRICALQSVHRYHRTDCAAPNLFGFPEFSISLLCCSENWRDVRHQQKPNEADR